MENIKLPLIFLPLYKQMSVSSNPQQRSIYFTIDVHTIGQYTNRKENVGSLLICRTSIFYPSFQSAGFNAEEEAEVF